MRTRKIALLFLMVVGGIQLIRPPHNSNPVVNENDLSFQYALPSDVKTILQQACYDCHSNSTRYPWYSNLQPVGWWMQHHVDEGKQALNFSEFGTYQKEDHPIILREMDDVLATRTMPLSSYKLVHPEARLTEEQVRRLQAWIQSLRESIPKDR